VAKGFFASRGKWTMSNAEWTIFRAAEAMPSFGTSPPGPLSWRACPERRRGKRGKRGLGGKGGEVQENNEKLTIDNTESTIFRAAEALVGGVLFNCKTISINNIAVKMFKRHENPVNRSYRIYWTKAASGPAK
jgi:hypothetical protein